MGSWPPNHFVDNFANGRRQAPRCEAKLRVSLRFCFNSLAVEANASAHSSPEMLGETLNMSEKGLAVAVPSNHIDHHYLNVAGSRLHLKLNLPDEPVEMHATTVWCRWHSEEERTEGYIVGLRITEMNDEEWVRLVRYIHAFFNASSK
jgi:hypothetical protein